MFMTNRMQISCYSAAVKMALPVQCFISLKVLSTTETQGMQVNAL